MKKYLLPVLGVTVATLMACSDDSSSSPSGADDTVIGSSDSVDPTNPATLSSASAIPDPGNGGENGGSTTPAVDPAASTLITGLPSSM